MKKIFSWLLIIICLFSFLIPSNVFAKEKINIYLFYSETCPHCHKADEYITNTLLNEREDITYYKYECTTDTNAYNRNIFNQVIDLYEIENPGYPLLIIGNEPIIGFSEDTSPEEYNKIIDFYKDKNYKDEVGILLGIVDDKTGKVIRYNDKSYIIDVPIIGKVNLKNLSLPVISIIIGLTDGFNPCAMWVLLFLIALLFNLKDKKKMWTLGLAFIFTSGFIYYLYMMAWLKVNDYLNEIKLFRYIIAAVALGFGLYQLYKYIKTRKDEGCDIVSKEKRKFVTTKIKKLVLESAFPLAVIGIMLLACFINLVELLCSLGLPVMFTEILSLNNLTPGKYNLYMLIYIIFFLLDDMLVFGISMITLKQTGISTKYNKYSHLIGGIIMVLIGLLMIFKPGWLSFNFS